MEKAKVSCWKHHEIPGNSDSDMVYYTIPKHAYGHNLLSCLNCGEIYAYDVMAPEYLIPLNETLEKINCIKCGKKLSESSKPYPDFYLNPQNEIKRSSYVRSGKEENVITKEFWDLYS